MSNRFGHRGRFRYLASAGALCVLLMSTAAQADNLGYDRPGLGFSPAVLQAGDVTWEQGLPDWSHSQGASLYSADTLLRLGVGGPFELQFGTSYNRLSGVGPTASGRGDSSVGLKFALPAAGAFSWGLLGSVTFTDGNSRFGSANKQYLLAAAFNWQVNARDALGAYVETVHGSEGDGQLIAVNAGRALSDALGVYVEAGWQHAAGVGSGSMAGAGATWQVTPRVQLDGSFRHRLGGDVDTWQAGLGVSVFFGRL